MTYPLVLPPRFTRLGHFPRHNLNAICRFAPVPMRRDNVAMLCTLPPSFRSYASLLIGNIWLRHIITYRLQGTLQGLVPLPAFYVGGLPVRVGYRCAMF